MSFFKGTLFLMAVIFSSKLLGFIYRAQFMRIAGEQAVGIYMTTYPAFLFFITLMQLGIPIAVAKLTASYYARAQYGHVRKVWLQSVQLSILSCIAFIPIIFFTIPYIAQTLLQNINTMYLLYVALITAPIVIIGSLMRAYLQGIANISPTAWAQLAEQLTRIALTMFVLPSFIIGQSPTMIAVYAMAITACGEIISLCITAFFFYKVRPTHKKIEKSMSKPIIRLALPSAGSKLFGTFTWFLEPIFFLKALVISGVTASTASTLYGIIAGVHIPLLLFPAFIPNALAIVLIPAVSDALARANHKTIQQRVQLSLRISAVIGCTAATCLFLHGDELAVKLFHLSENKGYMKILAPIFFFYYLQPPLHAILQAVDEARAAMMNSIYGGCAKLIVLLAFASQSFLQERGAILAIGFGVMITTFLHIATLYRHEQLPISLKPMLIPYAIFLFLAITLTKWLPEWDFYSQFAFTICITFVVLLFTNQLRIRDFIYIYHRLRP